MDIIPPIAIICDYLDIGPSILKNPNDERVVIKAQFLRLLLSMAVSQLPFDAEWYCEAHPDIREAFEAGEITDLREHFVSTGFFEAAARRRGGAERGLVSGAISRCPQRHRCRTGDICQGTL